MKNNHLLKIFCTGLYIFRSFIIFFISFSKKKEKNQTSLEKSIWLVGDSILDNSYWNNVQEKNTGEVLKRITKSDKRLQCVKVKDRSTEELAASTLHNHLYSSNQKKITVGNNYINKRNKLNIPYEEYKDGYDFNLFNYNKSNDILFLSIGGNDIVLHNKKDVRLIVKNIFEIIKWFKERVKHVVYIIPYKPFDADIIDVSDSRKDWNTLYEEFRKIIDNKNDIFKNIDVIDLKVFTDDDRIAQSRIPEPTIQGANKIAFMIREYCLNHMKT